MTTFLILFFFFYLVAIPLRRAIKRRRQAMAQRAVAPPVYLTFGWLVATPLPRLI
jgi:hypothetical protein